MLIRIALMGILVVTLGCTANAGDTTKKAPMTPLDFVVKDIDGKDLDLKSLRGKAVLVVNVASECGYTPQYAELQQLHERYKDKGLVILAFPSNDHGGQEPNDGAAIKKFAADEYGVTFQLMTKVHTAGEAMAPLYKSLTSQKGAVKWNFTKFLVGKDGVVRQKFDSGVVPTSPELTSAVDAALAG